MIFRAFIGALIILEIFDVIPANVAVIDEKKWFSLAGNNYVRNPNAPNGLSQIDNKTLQWFGATVSASIRDGGPILVSKLFNNKKIFNKK